MLSYARVGGKEYVCSGWGARTDWYQNIKANPLVTVQVGRREYPAKARRVDDIEEYKNVVEKMFETGGDSHFGSWLESFGIEFTKEDMIAKRDRLYIVGFDKSDEDGPPPMAVNLKWMWGMIILIGVGAWWIVR